MLSPPKKTSSEREAGGGLLLLLQIRYDRDIHKRKREADVCQSSQTSILEMFAPLFELLASPVSSFLCWLFVPTVSKPLLADL